MSKKGINIASFFNFKSFINFYLIYYSIYLGIAENTRKEAGRHKSLDVHCDYQEEDVEARDMYYESMAFVPLPSTTKQDNKRNGNISFDIDDQTMEYMRTVPEEELTTKKPKESDKIVSKKMTLSFNFFYLSF